MTSKRKRMGLVVGFLLLASMLLVAFMLQPSAADLLTQALETTQTISDGHAIIEVELDVPEHSETATVEVWGRLGEEGRRPPAFRLEVVDSSQEKALGVIAVSDGKELWVWHPAGNTVYTATADEIMGLVREAMAEHEFDPDQQYNWDEADVPETPEEVVAKVLEYFTAERDGIENVGDTLAYKVRLVPNPEQMPDEVRAAGGFLNVWVAAASKAPLGIEYAEGAAGYGKATATSLEFNQGVDDTIFTFGIPAGADVVRIADLAEQAMAEAAVPPDFATLSPTELPDGARLLDASSVSGAIVQRYSLPDGESFTVAQGPAAMNFQPDGAGTSVTVRGTIGMLFTDDDGGRTLLSWTEEGTKFWVGGDLTVEQAMAIAESLR